MYHTAIMLTSSQRSHYFYQMFLFVKSSYDSLYVIGQTITLLVVTIKVKVIYIVTYSKFLYL